MRLNLNISPLARLCSLVSIFSISAHAMVSALPEQILCGADYVVVGVVRSASGSEPGCVSEFCPESRRGNIVPIGNVKIEIVKVLNEHTNAVSDFVTGNIVSLRMGPAIEPYSEEPESAPKREKEENGGEVRKTGIDVEGKKFVFLIHMDTQNLKKSLKKVGRDQGEENPYLAEIWVNGESDKRMRCAIIDSARKSSATEKMQSSQACEERYRESCMSSAQKK